jgi:hypothetical protein
VTGSFILRCRSIRPTQIEESVLKQVLVVPVIACLAGCITVGGGDTLEQDLDSDGKIGTVANLVSQVWRHSDYYASVRSSTRAVRSQEGPIRESFRKLQALYPDALFPNVYFLIGAMNSGGISIDRGLVIGVELFCRTPSSPLDELNPWERSVVQPIDKIPQVVAHELIHYQQNFEKLPKSLLERSIAEGEADFLSEIVAGAQINELQHRYGDRHEEMVWNEFRDAMYGTDYSRWLYNGGALAGKGQPITRPADLGYYVGYKICQAFYDKAEDKKKAVKEMLEIRDFERVLQESGYGSSFVSSAQGAGQPAAHAIPADTIAYRSTSEPAARIVKISAH